MHNLTKAKKLKVYFRWPSLAPNKLQPVLLSEISIAKVYTLEPWLKKLADTVSFLKLQ